MKDTRTEGSVLLTPSVVLLEVVNGNEKLVKEFDMIKNCDKCKLNWKIFMEGEILGETFISPDSCS